MTKARPKLKKFFKVILIFFALILSLILAVFIYLNAKINYYSKTLSLDENTLTAAYLKPQILSSNGEDFSSFKFSKTANIDEISHYVKDAFISIEDKKF